MDSQTTCRPKATPAPSDAKLPSLDGWRALSILLVLGNHIQFARECPAWLKTRVNLYIDGLLGVQCFFCISGFLITWLLLKEWQKYGAVSLKNFYLRRALRILPVYFAFLLVLYLLGPKDPWRQSPEAWFGCLTFTRNYFGIEWWNNLTARHLWSLSIEEQFYLVWPSLLILTLKIKRHRTTAGVIIIVALLSTVFRHLAINQDIPAQFTQGWGYGIPLLICFIKSADGLAFGALGAILYTFKQEPIRSILTRRPKTIALLASAAVLLAETCPVRYEMKPLIQALGINVLLLQSLFLAHHGFYQFLNWKPIVQIGILSYSLYIWHQLVWFFGPNAQNPAWLIVRLIIIFTIATASYYLLEKPLTNLRRAFQDQAPRPTMPLPATAS